MNNKLLQFTYVLWIQKIRNILIFKIKNDNIIYQKWREKEDSEFFYKCLNKLGLCERTGLDGISMLYPVKSKERKLENAEYKDMM